MRMGLRITLMGVVVAGLAYAAVAGTRTQLFSTEKHVARAHAVLPMDDSAWQDGPPGMPAGSRFAVISGEPTQPAPFAMRVELPPGYSIAPYRRPSDENIVVLAGLLEVGTGKTFDRTRLHALPAGSFITLPANEAHFVTSKKGAIVQIFGMGPFAIEYTGTVPAT